MFLDKGKEIDFFSKIFNKDRDIDSIFIHNWDSIFIYKEEDYQRIKCSFSNKKQYHYFVKNIKGKQSNKNDDNYFKLSNNLDVHIHIWHSDDVWVTLKRIPN